MSNDFTSVFGMTPNFQRVEKDIKYERNEKFISLIQLT